MGRIVATTSVGIAVIVCLMLLSSRLYAQDSMTAKQIVNRMLQTQALGFQDGRAQVKMIIQSRRGNQRIRILDVKTKTKNGLKYSLATFLEPDDIAGTKFLSIQKKEGADLQYLYLPAQKQTRRIAGDAKRDQFLGTDFTYSDLEQRDIEDATYKRLEDEPHSGIACFHVVAYPRSSESLYSKIEMWIDKQDLLPLKIYFYDRSGRHFKTFIAQVVEPVSGKMTITKLLMKTLPKHTKTYIVLENLDRAVVYPDYIFDPANLSK